MPVLCLRARVGKRLFSVSRYSEIPIFQKAIPRFQPDSNFLEQIKKQKIVMRGFVPRFQFIKFIWNRLFPLKSYSYANLFQYSNIPESFLASREFDIVRLHQLVQNHATQNPTHISQLPTKCTGILEYWNKYIYSSSTTIYMLYIGLVFSSFSIPLVLFLTNKNSSPIPISLNLFQFQPHNSNSKQISPNYAYFSTHSKFIVQPTLNTCVKK